MYNEILWLKYITKEIPTMNFHSMLPALSMKSSRMTGFGEEDGLQSLFYFSDQYDFQLYNRTQSHRIDSKNEQMDSGQKQKNIYFLFLRYSWLSIDLFIHEWTWSYYISLV